MLRHFIDEGIVSFDPFNKVDGDEPHVIYNMSSTSSNKDYKQTTKKHKAQTDVGSGSTVLCNGLQNEVSCERNRGLENDKNANNDNENTSMFSISKR